MVKDRNSLTKDDENDSMEGSSPSPPSVASHHPHHPHHPFSNFSNALGGLSALTSGLSMASMASAGSGAGGAAHPPLTPSPSSDSPQQVDGASRPPNSSQQSWTFEEQFKQVNLHICIFAYLHLIMALMSRYLYQNYNCNY